MPRGKWDRKAKQAAKNLPQPDLSNPKEVHDYVAARPNYVSIELGANPELVDPDMDQADKAISPDMGQAAAPPPYNPGTKVVGERGAMKFIEGLVTLTKEQIINSIGRSPQGSPTNNYLTAWIQYETYETLLEIRDLLAEIKDKSVNV